MKKKWRALNFQIPSSTKTWFYFPSAAFAILREMLKLSVVSNHDYSIPLGRVLIIVIQSSQPSNTGSCKCNLATGSVTS